jgi:hypothetical protein
MATGDVIRLRNYRHYGQSGKSWADIRHRDKDKVFVCVVIGDAPKVSDQITDKELEDLMGDLGWKRMTENQFEKHMKKRGYVVKKENSLPRPE